MTDDAFEIGIDVNPRPSVMARLGMSEEACVALAAEAIQEFLDNPLARDQELGDLTIVFNNTSYRLGDLAEVIVG